jgi:hypothetical protein
MRRIALAPCSPFSGQRALMRETGESLARCLGVRLHTHLAGERRRRRLQRRALRRATSRGSSPSRSAGGRRRRVARALREARTARASRRSRARARRRALPVLEHAPGMGIAPVRAFRDAGVAVGLGVDGSASNDGAHGARLRRDRRCCSSVSRYGPGADEGARGARDRDARRRARVLGRGRHRRARRPALPPTLARSFDLTGPAHAGASHDPVAALVLCAPGAGRVDDRPRPRRRARRTPGPRSTCGRRSSATGGMRGRSPTADARCRAARIFVRHPHRSIP